MSIAQCAIQFFWRKMRIKIQISFPGIQCNWQTKPNLDPLIFKYSVISIGREHLPALSHCMELPSENKSSSWTSSDGGALIAFWTFPTPPSSAVSYTLIPNVRLPAVLGIWLGLESRAQWVLSAHKFYQGTRPSTQNLLGSGPCWFYTT